MSTITSTTTTTTTTSNVYMFDVPIHRLFPSSKDSPRVVITNGMMIPNYSSKELYEKMHAQGVTMYGQMTAGSYCCTPPHTTSHLAQEGLLAFVWPP